MPVYDICGLKTECDFRTAFMLERAGKYLSEEAVPDLRVNVPEEALSAFGRRYPHISPGERELMLTGDDFYRKLIPHGGYMLHSSAVELDGCAYLFSAPSGTGKSTHTGQWLKLFGSRARIINDDKPAIREINGRLCACGTPWSGKYDISENVLVPLKGICFLERSEKNFIERTDDGTAAFLLLDQTQRPEAAAEMELLLSLLDATVTAVPIWRMGCDISTDAARLAYETMSGGR